jgi:hypothetical protein
VILEGGGGSDENWRASPNKSLGRQLLEVGHQRLVIAQMRVPLRFV